MKNSLVLVTVGVVNNGVVHFVGTGFCVSKNKVVTASHVLRGLIGDLIVSPKVEIKDFSDYQDETQDEFLCIPAKIIEDDPFKDLSILEAEIQIDFNKPLVTGLDGMKITETVAIYGFPHCSNSCRKILTYQTAIVGAKTLLLSDGIKSKHAVLNMQARPGQSGSPVISTTDGSIVGVLVGAYIRKGAELITIADMTPGDFNQTTYCVSSEYIKDML
ncbi:V8-like Glu-specific endopeptidase [Raoultella terrigena]|uniref:V8-like Glu-specific endopeptidase n=1 Tax=Raoultella terrigena TaxID=577 RepID=A0A3P8JI75_RAOTE|nr:V8-like Glu-specific endopeptidase [Raoultella terrigena]